jgi:hypothetical protein
MHLPRSEGGNGNDDDASEVGSRSDGSGQCSIGPQTRLMGVRSTRLDDNRVLIVATRLEQVPAMLQLEMANHQTEPTEWSEMPWLALLYLDDGCLAWEVTDGTAWHSGETTVWPLPDERVLWSSYGGRCQAVLDARNGHQLHKLTVLVGGPVMSWPGFCELLIFGFTSSREFDAWAMEAYYNEGVRY